MPKQDAIRRFKTIAALGSVLVAVAVVSGRHAHAGETTPAPAPDAHTAVLPILKSHCSSCHQSAQATAAAPIVSSIGNILELDELAHDPTLVVPGQPDKSRLYQVLLSRHQPQFSSQAGPGPAWPGAEDIDTFRDWIEGLPENASTCGERATIGEADTLAAMQKWRRQIGSGMEDFRFVTLGFLANACLADTELERARAGVASAIGHLSRQPAFSTVWPVDSKGTLLAFRLEDAGLTSTQWTEIVTQAPRTVAGAVPGEWLAHRAGNAESAGLARHYRKDVGLRQAASELGMTEGELSERLSSVVGPDARIAKPLRQGLISRASWEGLIGVLQGNEASFVPLAGLRPDRVLRLRLWSDKVVYRSGDLTALTALATGDCYLTLIGIDHRGSATVLFPNEFEQTNFLRGGTPMTVPLATATYQLRVQDPGTETIVGVCSTVRQRMTGVLTDYERQRFTVLGNWRLFLATADQLETSIARASRRSLARSGRALRSGVPSQEARSAISYRVEPNPIPAVQPLPVTAITR